MATTSESLRAEIDPFLEKAESLNSSPDILLVKTLRLVAEELRLTREAAQ